MVAYCEVESFHRVPTDGVAHHGEHHLHHLSAAARSAPSSHLPDRGRGAHVIQTDRAIRSTTGEKIALDGVETDINKSTDRK